MAPNAPFFNFNLDNHAVLVRQNVCHQINYNNNSSTLLRNRLRTIKENFVAVNSHYLKENYIEPVSNFSSPSTVKGEKNENTWLYEIRSTTSMRLELIRKTMAKESIRKKLEIWQHKKDEMSRNRNVDVSPEPKVRQEEILIKKENYQSTLERIQKRSIDVQQTIASDYEKRSREICFKVAVARAVLVVNYLNDRFDDQRLVSIIGAEMDAYRAMESRLNALKTTVHRVDDETLLNEAQSLLERLTLYKNNVVAPIQAQIEARKTEVKRNPLKVFSVNVPAASLTKIVKRQYVALVKNNKALIKNLTNVRDLPFASDPTTKALRQNVIKVVNTLVNTVSCTSASHLTEKYDKLDALLSGRLVCAANTRVMLGDNQEALAFGAETLAKKVIDYAEHVVSVKTSFAHEIAEIVVRLWADHRQFGKILVTEMKQKCPFLAPFFYPVAKCLADQQPDVRSFGYKCDASGNAVESHDTYLKRMAGIVRLYAALVVASAKHDNYDDDDDKGQQERRVFGLSQAWIFVAGTLNQNPVADITATVLVEFFAIAGFAMHRAYGRQFVKLLHYVHTRFMDKIVRVTPAGHGGPVARLNNFISKSIRDGSVEPPTGTLPPDFW